MSKNASKVVRQQAQPPRLRRIDVGAPSIVPTEAFVLVPEGYTALMKLPKAVLASKVLELSKELEAFRHPRPRGKKRVQQAVRFWVRNEWLRRLESGAPRRGEKQLFADDMSKRILYRPEPMAVMVLSSGKAFVPSRPKGWERAECLFADANRLLRHMTTWDRQFEEGARAIDLKSNSLKYLSRKAEWTELFFR